jgi:hypothetical protein
MNGSAEDLAAVVSSGLLLSLRPAWWGLSGSIKFIIVIDAWGRLTPLVLEVGRVSDEF